MHISRLVIMLLCFWGMAQAQANNDVSAPASVMTEDPRVELADGSMRLVGPSCDSLIEAFKQAAALPASAIGSCYKISYGSYSDYSSRIRMLTLDLKIAGYSPITEQVITPAQKIKLQGWFTNLGSSREVANFILQRWQYRLSNMIIIADYQSADAMYFWVISVPR